MRNATWRSHVLRPGRPCMMCNGQLDPAMVTIDRQGLLDDPAYIEGAGRSVEPRRQNVAALSGSVSAGLLAQFASLVVAPGGRVSPDHSATPSPPMIWSMSKPVLERTVRSSRPPLPVTPAFR